MTDREPAEDPWMTIAEFAEELRVRPVTVRSWIGKGKVQATRAGQRKWLLRRSELTRMLRGDGKTNVPSPSPSPPAVAEPPRMGTDQTPPEILESMAHGAEADQRESLEHEYAASSYEWGIALEHSRMAPPDARFPSRIRQIAHAASYHAVALRECMAEERFVWKPVPDSTGMTLSYELRPGGNRPGPEDGWARFDRIVARLGDAMQGPSPGAVARALTDLAGAMTELAEAIEKRPAWRPPEDASGSPADLSATPAGVSQSTADGETP